MKLGESLPKPSLTECRRKCVHGRLAEEKTEPLTNTILFPILKHKNLPGNQASITKLH